MENRQLRQGGHWHPTNQYWKVPALDTGGHVGELK